MSQSTNENIILADIKLESTVPSTATSEANYNIRVDDDGTDTHNEVYNSDLIADLRPNEQITSDILEFTAARNQEKNRTNLINYCGILDADAETEGCARVNSIYVPKFGKSHIKSEYNWTNSIMYFNFFSRALFFCSSETKIVNPYGALSQMYHQEVNKIQQNKLAEFTSCELLLNKGLRF